VGEFKRDHDLPPADPEREAVQVARLRSLAEHSHLDPDFAERLIRFIIDEVIRNHDRIRQS
jgi:chorismate mutase